MNGFRNLIMPGDALVSMPTIPSNYVQCVVTSPPYFALRSYLPAGHPDKPKEIGSEPTPEAFIATMVAVFREVRRVLRDDGVCFINLGDSYDCGTSSPRKASPAVQHGYWENGGAMGDNRVTAGLQPGTLLNTPHRVAEALRQDGWNWRQTIVWAKKSPMPESVRGWAWRRCRVKVANGSVARWGDSDLTGKSTSTDLHAKWSTCPGCPKCSANDGWILQRGKGRCTTAHEYIFVMTKGERYFWDGEASKEAATCAGLNRASKVRGEFNGKNQDPGKEAFRSIVEQRNPRSYWLLSSEPTREKHFAAFPSELVRRCLVAGCSAGGCCAKCGAPFAPMVESERVATRPGDNHKETLYGKSEANTDAQRHVAISRTLGYRQTCSCLPATPGRQIVFDPFSGTGTVAQTARQLGHDYLGCELNPAYIEISDKRISEPPRWFIRQQNANKPKRPKPVIVAPGQLSLFGSMEESA